MKTNELTVDEEFGLKKRDIIDYSVGNVKRILGLALANRQDFDVRFCATRKEVLGDNNWINEIHDGGYLITIEIKPINDDRKDEKIELHD